MVDSKVVEYGNKIATYNGKICLAPINRNYVTGNYGRLYNGYAIDDSRKIAIGDWRVPSGDTFEYENQFNELNTVIFSEWYGDYLVVAFNVSPYIKLYKVTGGTLTYITTVDIQPTSIPKCFAWSVDGYLAVGCTSSKFLILYKLIGETLIKQTDPDLDLLYSPVKLSWNPTGTHLVVGYIQSTHVYVYLYKLNTGVLNRLSSYGGLYGTNFVKLMTTWNGNYLALSANDNASTSSPTSKIYILQPNDTLTESYTNNTSPSLLYFINSEGYLVYNTSVSYTNLSTRFNGVAVESFAATNVIIPTSTITFYNYTNVAPFFTIIAGNVIYNLTKTYYIHTPAIFAKTFKLYGEVGTVNAYSVDLNGNVMISDTSNNIYYNKFTENGDFFNLVIRVDARGGRHLKETGTTYWAANNGLNTLKFNARGGGRRRGDGVFENLNYYSEYWSIKTSGNNKYSLMLEYTNSSNPTDDITIAKHELNTGLSVRLCRNATTNELNYLDGTSCEPYYDYEGNKYPTVKIGKLVWLAKNLKTMYFNNGDKIPDRIDGSSVDYYSAIEWYNLTTPACCIYNNNIINL